MIMKEIWKDIKGYEDFYQVSNMGRIKSKSRPYTTNYYKPGKIKEEKILNPFSSRGGYLVVDLRKDGKRKNVSIHQLVATAFIPNPENKSQVNHKKGIKRDNRVTELEWATPKENVVHSYETGLKVNYRSSSHYRSNGLMIIDYKKKKTISFPNARCASEYLGVSAGTVWRYLHGIRRHSTYNFFYI